MMLKILTVFLKTSNIIVNPLCDISPSLMVAPTYSTLQVSQSISRFGDRPALLPPRRSRPTAIEQDLFLWKKASSISFKIIA
jgi:hypothetical protein